MSTIAIPNYPQACLAPDHANSAVYLAGVPAAQLGRLEVNYVSVANVNSPVASIVTSLVDTDAWTSSASKTCFIDPSAASLPNPSVKIIQFGNFKTFYTTVRPNGSIDKAVTFGSVSFLSPRLFAWTGTVPKGAFDLYTVYTNITFGHDVTSWMGFRMEFRINYLSYGDPSISNSPMEDPMLALGTYTGISGNVTNGHTTVFNKNGRALVYATQGKLTDQGVDKNQMLHVGVGLETVIMNGITVSPDAIPVTMGSTGYLLDRASDGTTVIYSLTPDRSVTLQHVFSKSNVPPFSATMAATALNKQIITYSASFDGAPIFNSFDTTTGIWSGHGLVSTNGTGDSGPSFGSPTVSTPVAAIIGGVIGGLVLVATFVFFGVRGLCRRDYRKADGSSTNDGDKSKGDKGEISPEKAYQHPSSYIPPPPPIQSSAVSYEAYQPNKPSEINTMDLNPTVNNPHILLNPTNGESIGLKMSPQYVDPNSQVSLSNAKPLNPQYVPQARLVDDEHSPESLWDSPSTPRNPQLHPIRGGYFDS